MSERFNDFSLFSKYQFFLGCDTPIILPHPGLINEQKLFWDNLVTHIKIFEKLKSDNELIKRIFMMNFLDHIKWDFNKSVQRLSMYMINVYSIFSLHEIHFFRLSVNEIK